MLTKIATAPATEPVTLTEVKKDLRLAVTDADATAYTHEDTTLTGLIKTARRLVEDHTRRALITQTWDGVIDAFPSGNSIELPHAPLQSVTSISYTESDGNSATFTDFTADLYGNRIKLDYGAIWPTVYPESVITIRFVCGYGTAAADVPEEIRLAIRLLVSFWRNNPEAAVLTYGSSEFRAIPYGVDTLLASYRRYGF